MSFQGLVSGSECGTSANPLAQVLKHTDGDRSLQQVRPQFVLWNSMRLIPTRIELPDLRAQEYEDTVSKEFLNLPDVCQLHQLPTGVQQVGTNEQDLALARQFFDPKAQEHGFGPGFAMHHAPDLSRLEHRPDLQEAWAKEHNMRQLEEHAASAGWSTEFNAAPQLNGSGPAMQSHGVAMQGPPRSMYMPTMNRYSSPLATGMYGGMGMQQYGYNPGLETVNKGKGKSREADFEAAFAQIAESMSAHGQSKSEEDVERLEEALRQATLEQSEDLKAAWDEMQKSDIPSTEDDLAKWESEFSQMMNAQRDELDYGESMQNAWESGLGDFQEGASTEKPLQFDDEGVPLLGEYIFGRKEQPVLGVGIAFTTRRCQSSAGTEWLLI
ncbi:hypothetical protein NMY22_g20052 [Coprinellus aureogranulatus]|nr:hypothetical protein NMY22_g20052 [Coprinellus aureogranulatus]